MQLPESEQAGDGHGTMTRENWLGVLDQAAAHGIPDVQFIGGEPTMHPDFTELVEHALDLGLAVEVYSNLVHVSEERWALFQRERLSVATSYYSARAGEHDAMTGRSSHRRTRANIRCGPDSAPCSPDNAPPQTCGPDDNQGCTPGTPPSTCNPRR